MITPTNYACPKWDEAGKAHDWRNHIGKEVQQMWDTFTDAQKQALARAAEELADREEWE